MIYEIYDMKYNAIYRPDANKIKVDRWQEFLKKPQPTMSMALNHEDLKGLIKKREEEHHEAVKKEIEKLRLDYNFQKDAVILEFKLALAQEYLDNPNHVAAEKLFELARGMGHSYGFHDHSDGFHNVEAFYGDMAELLNYK